MASAIGGGFENIANASVVSRGEYNTANNGSWVGGGYKNNAGGRFSSIFGGREVTATESYQAIP